jgi:hypothetical protein
VFVDLQGRVDCWTVHKGKLSRFADLNEARHFAELRDYDDGIHVVVARGYGLKPRLKKLMGGKTQDD